MTTTTRVLSPSNASTGDPAHAFSKQCLNCGQVGHVYRHCPSPLTSYGILLFRRRPAAPSNATTTATGAAPPPPPPTIEYLMICRRHSFGYVEFVRVNFDLRDEPYIRQLMSEMTKDERAKLRAAGTQTRLDSFFVRQEPRAVPQSAIAWAPAPT